MKKILVVCIVILAMTSSVFGAGSTNFKQWDPNLASLETDSAYNVDSRRQSGASTGVFPKETFNKVTYQTSAFVTALAQALAAKGYVINDGSAGVGGNDFNALVVAMSNILTNADPIPGSRISSAVNLSATANHLTGLAPTMGTYTMVNIGAISGWVVPAGIFEIVVYDQTTDAVSVQILDGPDPQVNVWRGYIDSGKRIGGTVISDGVTVRIYNAGAVPHNIAYRKVSL